MDVEALHLRRCLRSGGAPYWKLCKSARLRTGVLTRNQRRPSTTARITTASRKNGSRVLVGTSKFGHATRLPPPLRSSEKAPVVATEKADRHIFFTTEMGIPMEIEVSATSKVWKVSISVRLGKDSGAKNPSIYWCLFRKKYGPLFDPTGRSIKAKSNWMKLSMNSIDADKYQAKTEIDCGCLPAYMACRMETDDDIKGGLSNGEVFVIPIGMLRGNPFPKGTSLFSEASSGNRGKTFINFAVLSRNATSMTLCIFDVASEKFVEVELFEDRNKTGDVWHVAVDVVTDLTALRYGWKADGSHGWEGGSRFHPNTILLDPYAKLVQSTKLPDSKKKMPLLASLEHITAKAYEWGDNPRPRRGFEELIASELNLISLPRPTVTSALNVISTMAESGINAVILRGAMLAIADAADKPSPLSFFAPNCQIFSNDSPGQSAVELKKIVRECHRKSMEVLIEVQFCFTSEDADKLSLKGLDVSLYFRGKGILNCGHPIVQELVIDALRHWVKEYKVDGFVFTNSETMVQNRDGNIQDSPSLPSAIAADPLLRSCKLIAVSGNDQLLPRQGVRGFPHWGVWTEYNTRFQSDFWKFMVTSQPAMLSNIATRITGSADLFADGWEEGFPGSLAVGRRPAFGFNSPVPCFSSLIDSVEAHVPKKQDLGGFELSSSTTLLHSMLTALVISQGVPVFPNDCWASKETTQFISNLIQFRMRCSDLIQPIAFDAVRDLEWHGAFSGHQPDWDGIGNDRFIGLSINDNTGRRLYAAFNANNVEVEVQAPNAEQGSTFKCVSYSATSNGRNDTFVSPLSTFHMTAKSALILETVVDVKAVGVAFTPEI